MVRTLLGPFAHLLFDDAGIDPVTTRRDGFLGDFLHEALIPLLNLLRLGSALGQAAAQDLECTGKGDTLRVDVLGCGRLLHQHPDQIMSEHQGIDFLHDPGGGLTAQHGTFALMGLEFVKGDFDTPSQKPL